MNATLKTVVGVDTAKNVFQLYTVDKETGEVINNQVKRTQFLQWFVNHATCLVGMEACGGSQHWARKLQEFGHDVKLMSGKVVKAFVCGNKNDAADARAIYMAAQQPEVKAVAVKTEAQQAVLAMHRIRQGLVKMRTAQMNAIRGLVGEYGEVFGLGRKAFDAGMKAAFGRLAERLPVPLIETLREQWNELARLDERIAHIEKSLQAWLRQDRAAKAISAIPGVGLLTATAAVATMGDAKAFRSGREFAAFTRDGNRRGNTRSKRRSGAFQSRTRNHCPIRQERRITRDKNGEKLGIPSRRRDCLSSPAHCSGNGTKTRRLQRAGGGQATRCGPHAGQAAPAAYGASFPAPAGNAMRITIGEPPDRFRAGSHSA